MTCGVLTLLVAGGVLWARYAPRIGRNAALERDTIIMVVGDSLADGLASGFWRLDPRHLRYTVLNETRISSGLARHDEFDWKDVIGKLVQEHRPSAVVMFIGLNDARPSAMFGSAAWEQAYRSRIAAILAIVESESIKTIWVGLPVMRDPELHRHAAYLNRLYQDEIAHAQHAQFVDLWGLTGGADSSYKRYIANRRGNLEQFREQDGIHFTPFGYEVLAERILQAVI
jgi:uncharacterized protein